MFTVILMEAERTDKQPRSFRLTRQRLVWLITAFIGVPVLGFVLGLLVFAPLILNDDAQQAKRSASTLAKQVERMSTELTKLREEFHTSRQTLTEEQQSRATAEARITMAETARLEAISRLQALEDEVFQLTRQNAFYESFMQPGNNKATLQCFNISAKHSGSTVTYGVNFMKNNQKDRARVEAKVQFRVRVGEALLADGELEADHGSPVLATKDIAMVRDVRTTGSFKADVPSSGLRILDITALNKKGETIAHCWKSF